MVHRKVKIDGQSHEDRSQTAAAALEYDPTSDQAPRLVASGKGKIAEQIIALAKEHNIPVYDDPLLTAALADVNLGDEIPPELYLVVAEVLAYIYRVMDREQRGQSLPKEPG